MYTSFIVIFGSSLFVDFDLVDRMFFLSWSKCPSSVAKEVPINELKFNCDIPGNVDKLPLLIAFINVLKEGENIVA